MKHLYASLLAACMVAPAAFGAVNCDDIQKANIFHAFNWKFTDIQAELDRIAAAGYGAVQVSPVQGNCKENAEWYYAYMPYDFAMGTTSSKRNGNGTRDELKALCEAANAKGVQIIVDVVANHVNSKDNNRDKFWRNDAHQRDKGYVNYDSRNSIITGKLGEYLDVISEDKEVRDRAAAFVKDLKSLGVTGIRWDAAKHIGLPDEGCDFWPDVTAEAGMWHYGEILDNPGGGNTSSWAILRDYTNYMSVTDNSYCDANLSAFGSGSLPKKDGGHTRPASEGKAGISGSKVVLWGESHDTFSNKSGASKNRSQDVVDRAYMFVACRDKEAAIYFSRPNDANGNPVKAYSDIRMGFKGSVNGLENPAIIAVNNFRKAMTGRADCVTVSDAAASITRQGGGAVIILPTATEKQVTAVNGSAYLPSGDYKDIISGNTFHVTSSSISGKVGSTGVAVLAVEGTMGVDDIIADEADADAIPVYYNLQGQRVANPSGGVFIRRTGTRAEKVIL